MSNNTKPSVNLDGVDYNYDDLKDEQKALVEHIMDLDRKVNSAKFNLDQLQVGKDAFLHLLKESFKTNDVTDVTPKE